MYTVQTDQIFFIFVISFIFSSPVIVSLIWAYFTKQIQVHKKLLLASALLIVNPFVSASLFAFLQTRCRKGHIDQQFSQCGYIPDT